MDEPEREDDQLLRSKLSMMWEFTPSFVAIVGYTFSRQEVGYNDWVSLEKFVARYRCSPVNIFIIDPVQPYLLCEMLEERLKSKTIYAVPYRWKIVADEFLRGRASEYSLAYRHELILDKYGIGGRSKPD